MVVRRGRMQAEEAEKAVVVRSRRIKIRHHQRPSRIRHQQGREEVTAVVVRRRRMQAEEVEEAEDAEKAEEVGRRRQAEQVEEAVRRWCGGRRLAAVLIAAWIEVVVMRLPARALRLPARRAVSAVSSHAGGAASSERGEQ